MLQYCPVCDEDRECRSVVKQESHVVSGIEVIVDMPIVVCDECDSTYCHPDYDPMVILYDAYEKKTGHPRPGPGKVKALVIYQDRTGPHGNPVSFYVEVDESDTQTMLEAVFDAANEDSGVSQLPDDPSIRNMAGTFHDLVIINGATWMCEFQGWSCVQHGHPDRRTK